MEKVSRLSVNPSSQSPAPEVEKPPVPNKCRIIWQSLKLGLSQKEVSNLYKTGEMKELKQVSEGMGFFQTRKAAKVQVAIRNVLLQSVPQDEALSQEKVWQVAAELTRAVVLKSIQAKDGGVETMQRGKTYKAKEFNVPFSMQYNDDGSMLIKLKPGKGDLEIRALGAGAFGKVTRAIQIDAGTVRSRSAKMVAYKSQLVTYKHQDTDEEFKIAENEVRMNRAAKGCKNVGTAFTVTEYKGGAENVEKIGMIFEFCNRGDLIDFMMNGGFHALPEKDQLRLFREILVGVQELHKRNIVHLDLKPDNVMLFERDGELHARVVDLGIAAFTTDEVPPRGSPDWMAPELEKMGKVMHPQPSMDCYSLGNMAYFMFLCLRNDDGTFAEKFDEIPVNLWDMTNQLRDEDPENRLDTAGAIKLIDARLKELG